MAGLSLLGLGARPVADAMAARDEAEAPRAAAPAMHLAMVIDLPRCIEAGNCTDCVAACHKAHNVPLHEDPRHEIKWVWKESYERAFSDSAHRFVAAPFRDAKVPVLCNHCENPACTRVCPTQATWRRADGIVMMDEHRCIGCRYCMIACPYGARSFNYVDPRRGLNVDEANPDFPTRRRGVVEKCNFCVDRLARKLEPACVEACKAGAMAFGDLNDPGSTVRQLLDTHHCIRRNPGAGTNPQVYYLV